MKIVFICGPYSAKTQSRTDEHIAVAEQMAIILANKGLGFICPHLNSRNMHLLSLAKDDFWYRMYISILDTMDAMIILPGYKQSSGCKREIEHATKRNIPIFYNLDDLFKWAGKQQQN